MKKSIYLLAFVVFGLYSANVFSQEEVKEFEPSGKALVKIFTNYNYNFTEEEHGFQLTRAYFGYKYNMSENFSTKITFDVGDPRNNSRLKQTAFLKIAALTYKKDKITANFGLIGNRQFKFQEKNWGYRYLYKSFQDEHGFNSSADMGADIEYKASDFFSVDAFIYNGEGFRNIQADNTYKAGAGFIITPMKELTIRLVYDMQMYGSEMENMAAAFVGYENKKFRLGAEYNMKFNAGYDEDRDLKGMSFYGTYNIDEKHAVFARFDNLTANTLNIMDYGSAIIGGLQCTPVKNVNISLNYQGWIHEDDDNDAINMAYLNFEYKF